MGTEPLQGGRDGDKFVRFLFLLYFYFFGDCGALILFHWLSLAAKGEISAIILIVDLSGWKKN
ncbi:hypothetical protein CEV08_08645 [Bartonella tribocorum]|uniref:Uncharacterized protein n=1 Tax=Bartonella tribocorum TaxID=85701 RepID=A0A2N9Y8Q4_9HYPH|nr:hypothetical protein CEV08_08645 [Bartonella tribocorum]